MQLSGYKNGCKWVLVPSEFGMLLLIVNGRALGYVYPQYAVEVLEREIKRAVRSHESKTV